MCGKWNGGYGRVRMIFDAIEHRVMIGKCVEQCEARALRLPRDLQQYQLTSASLATAN